MGSDLEGPKEKEVVGKTWPQILAILIVSIGSFTNGIGFAWSSPFALLISHDKINYDISESDVSFFLFFQPIGMLITGCLFFYVTELLGRKKSVLFMALPQLLSWIITIFAKTKWDFYISRLVTGVGDGILFCAIPSYIGEITTPGVRNKYGNLPTFILYGGQVFINIIGSYYDVKQSAYICIGIPIVFFLLAMLLLPESPYQLIKDGRMEEARQSIKWLQRKSNVDKEFFAMKADVERQISESSTWKDLFTITSNWRALRAGAFLRVSQQFSGISMFAAYTQTVFEKAGGSINPQYSSIILTSLICVLNLVCSIVVAKFGRKSSYFHSVLYCGIVLFCMALYFFLEQYNLVNLEKLSWVPLAGMITYVFTFSFGLSVVPTLMLGELFSSSIKEKGLELLLAVFAIAVVVTTQLFYILTANVGLYSAYLLYAVACFVSTFLTIKWVPETKGKTLEEIQQDLKK